MSYLLRLRAVYGVYDTFIEARYFTTLEFSLYR